MVSEGVPGSNDRAAEGQLPQSGHAIPNTGKIYAAPRVALFGSWNWKLCFWFLWWWAVLRCSYCGSVFGVTSKKQLWIWGWICLKIGLNTTRLSLPWIFMKQKTESVTGSNLSEGFVRSNWSVTGGGHTAVKWHENSWADKSPLWFKILQGSKVQCYFT